MNEHDMTYRVSKLKVIKDRLHYLEDEELDRLLGKIKQPEPEELKEDIKRLSHKIR